MKNVDLLKNQVSKKFLRAALTLSILLLGHEAKTQSETINLIDPYAVTYGYSSISNGSAASTPFTGMYLGVNGNEMMRITPSEITLGTEVGLGKNLNFYNSAPSIKGIYEITGGQYGLIFRGSSNANVLRIDQNGKVGIGGTIAPNGALHVYGDDNNGATAGITIETPGGQLMLLDGNEIDAITSTLYLQNNVDYDLSLTAGGGAVGIGIIDPLEKTHILGNLRLDDGLFLTNKSMIFRPAVGDIGDSNTNNIIFQNNAEIEIMRINKDGNVGIGTSTPSQKLEVEGTIKATSFVSSASSFPDYVFESDYKLLSLKDVASYIEHNKHLPNMPSENEVIENGLDVSEVVVKSVENIEMIYLHLIQLNEKLDLLEKENAELKAKLNK